MILNYSQIRQIDLTNTLTLRRSFEMVLNKRFTLLKSFIKNQLIQNNTNTSIELNKIFSIVFGTEFVQDRERLIKASWITKYILDVYKRGVLRSRKELRNKGYTVPKINNDLLMCVFELPIYANKIQPVKLNIFNSLIGIVYNLSVYVQNTIPQSSIENIEQISNHIDEIGAKQIKMLMGSEIIKTYYSAIIHEYQNWGITDQGIFNTIEEERNNMFNGDAN